ncbi:hypothetical protein [Iodobacter fluviatilis]|uniref:Uncharacterized protein n=1 Tax=Iodobacter fluviatilis TaxID=537 RepID=A0A377Q9G5_9NEIS|nr:hypothetical protein [Iodobacter fluviatilis]TCU88720.1 hypothetical protein EV682_103304 [Iodobacter fluviatilis]STQ91209.1 Uncharacterised protein [Iodobacter fluviatilis]
MRNKVLGFLSCRRGWGVKNSSDILAGLIAGDSLIISNCFESRLEKLKERAETLQSFAHQDAALIKLVSDIKEEIASIERIERVVFKALAAAEHHE